jgi:hypothetical protein
MTVQAHVSNLAVPSEGNRVDGEVFREKKS